MRRHIHHHELDFNVQFKKRSIYTWAEFLWRLYSLGDTTVPVDTDILIYLLHSEDLKRWRRRKDLSAQLALTTKTSPSFVSTTLERYACPRMKSYLGTQCVPLSARNRSFLLCLGTIISYLLCQRIWRMSRTPVPRPTRTTPDLLGRNARTSGWKTSLPNFAPSLFVAGHVYW